jgi:hypothetical protein
MCGLVEKQHAQTQVKLTMWSTTSKVANILVTWAACDVKYDDQVTGPLPIPEQKPEVWVSETAGGKYKAFKGQTTSYIINSTSSGGSIYRSPYFNHVRVWKRGGEKGRREKKRASRAGLNIIAPRSPFSTVNSSFVTATGTGQGPQARHDLPVQGDQKTKDVFVFPASFVLCLDFSTTSSHPC